MCWLMVTQDGYELHTTRVGACASAEDVVKAGLDVDHLPAGWCWVYPADNPEGEHMYLVNVQSPALSVEVVRLPLRTLDPR